MSKRLFFADYSDVMQQNFTDLKDIHTFAKICIDTYKNQLQGQTQAQANTVIRNKIREVAGLPENPNELQIKRAFKKESVREAIFEILEETLDNTLITGWANDPWFRQYVEFKTMVLGTKNSFYIKADDMILNISKISGGHHNIERQRLNKGSEISVKTATYGAKVYMEMSRFLQGVEDWNELIDAISRAFTIQVNRMIHNQVMGAVKQLPVQTKWNRKGLANTANKKNFKELIADVKRATGSTAVIMGTEVALGELAGFGDVNWISEAAKNDIYTMGRLGNFEGTTIVELQTHSSTMMKLHIWKQTIRLSSCQVTLISSLSSTMKVLTKLLSIPRLLTTAMIPRITSSRLLWALKPLLTVDLVYGNLKLN